ncbi:conserved hypothetical protein [Microsporum canis CBS 113480]|uniref:Uncharacterized protein n=1 Tax=Arthroderma otae (strain ATCC MYA-4605 / CBS 113480) TaxID=554155 RepID=C5FW98_ARTOC|nr:conserved hypothetical protein [Microsporum canis CBS 113480]EEQ34182.1 conserved hypothetical protein [Microsporum canis CBS 113480]
MFSGSSSANQRVRRSKSSVSVQTRRPVKSSEAFDTELAQLQALAAASLAMRRHGNHPSSSSSGAKGSCDQPSSIDSGYRQCASLSGDNESESCCQTAHIAEPTIHEGSPSTFEQPRGEQDGFNVSSTSPRPSSYRRLRKSKSMFCTHRLSGSNELKHLPQRDNNRSASSGTGRLSHRTLRRSLSFLRGNGESKAAPNSRANPPNLPIELAREYLRRIFGRRLSGTHEVSPEQPDTQHGLNSPNIGSSEDSSCFDGSSDYTNYRDQLLSRNAANTAPSVRSMKSCSSMATSNSRVTSWTDSTAGNTITMKQPPPLARQGLDIIREDSDAYTPTPSPGRHRHDGYSIFRQPRDNAVNIDSQRMFSALMRNIDETKNKRIAKQMSSISQKTKSILESSANCSPLTIRAVKQSPSVSSVRCSRPALRGSPSSRSQISVRSSRTVRLTPQEIARKNEILSRKQSEQTIRGLDPNDLLGIPISQNEEINGLLQYQNERLDTQEDTGSVIIRRSLDNANPPLSPSVYSRTTGVMSPYQSRIDVDASDSDDEEGGTATILDSQRLPYRPRRTSQAIRGASGDWKIWMNSQMDLIDTAACSASLGNPTYSLPGHYREDTQINSPSPEELMLTQNKLITHEVSSLCSIHKAKAPDNKGKTDLAEAQFIPSNNFSRPLRSSPNGILSTCSTVVRKPSIKTSAIHQPYTPDICDSEMTPSPLSLRTRSASRTPTTASISPLLYHKTRPSVESALLEDSPIARGGQSSRARYGKSTSPICPSDGKQLLREIQFNPVRHRREPVNVTKENKCSSTSYRQSDRPNYASKLNGLHSTISTKRMVDIFLNERRQMTTRGSEDGTPEPAFL